ncbi:MAG: FmdB family zinc ribbon protein [Gemmatimonadaceae bacterium]
MPLFDYSCGDCGNIFEALVLKGKEPEACPSCGAKSLERLLSMPNVKSATTRALAMKAAQARDKKQGTERTQEQLRYERSHND